MQFVTLIFFFALVGGAAFLSAHWGANDWYRDLRKPGFTPPNWVFPIVWPILYALMAISGWLIWESDHPYRAAALALWTAQLALNALWPFLFFGRRNITAGMADIGALWIIIAGFIVLAAQISPLAALLFCPYLIWISVAGTLNWRILQLN
jgi:tryptophan-rich sensory protein